MILYIIKNKYLLLLILLVSLYNIFYVSTVYEFPYVFFNFRIFIVVLLIIISLFQVFNSIIIKKSILAINFLILLYALYTISWVLLNDGFDISRLLSSIYFPVIFLSSYSIFSFNKISVNFKIENYFSFLLIVFVFLFFYKILIQFQFQGMIINSIYYQVFLLPFVLMLKNRKLKLSLMLLILICIFFTLKRTPFIAFIFSILLYYKISNNINLKNIKNIFKFSWMLILISSFLFFLNNIFNNSSLNKNLIQRLFELSNDGGSGRVEILKALIVKFGDINLDQFIFGHGIFTVNDAIGIGGAHNDFFDMFWSYGIIGLIFYLLFYIYLFKYCKLFKKRNYKYYPVFVSSVLLFLIVSLFSQLIFIPSYFAFLLVFWAYIISNYYLTQKKILEYE
jgi:hypothetical protein